MSAILELTNPGPAQQSLGLKCGAVWESLKSGFQLWTLLKTKPPVLGRENLSRSSTPRDTYGFVNPDLG